MSGRIRTPSGMLASHGLETILGGCRAQAGRWGAAWGPSPIRAKTYAKEPPRLSICDDYVNKRGRVGGTP